MGLLFAKLSNYWQLRLFTIGLCVALVVYAVVMPVHSDESSNPSPNQSSRSTSERSNGAPSVPADQPSASLSASGSSSSSGLHSGSRLWIGENHAAADQLGRTANYYLSSKLPRDSNDLIRALQRAAAQDDPTAEFLLGHALQAGFGLSPDAAEGRRWMERASRVRAKMPGGQRNSSASSQGMGQSAIAYDGSASDRSPAENESAIAASGVGTSGIGGSRISLPGENSSGSNGVSSGSNGVTDGQVIADGRGASSLPYGPTSPTSFDQAFHHFSNLAEDGDPIAQLFLGLAYDRGDEVVKDPILAAHWYRKAAEQGSVSAICNLGELFRDGDGVPKDAVEAIRRLRQAASLGSANAQLSLGAMYLQGEGTTPDPVSAAIWLRKAAEQGNAPAEVLLGYLFVSGNGVAGDTAQAYMWINLAAPKDDQARIARNQLEEVLAAGDVAKGQQMTHAWLLRHPASL